MRLERQQMDLGHKRLGVIVVGKSGTGKSTFQTRFILGVRASVRFCFDHKHEYAHRLGVKPCRTVAEILAAIPTGFVVYDPSRMWPGQPVKGFDFFCRTVFHLAEYIPGRKIFSCEELQNWCGTDPRSLPVGLGMIVEEGRKWKLDSCMVAQANNAIHNRVRAQTSELIVFRTIEPRGLIWPKEQGMPLETIKALPDLHFIARNLDTGFQAVGALHHQKQLGQGTPSRKQVGKSDASPLTIDV